MEEEDWEAEATQADQGMEMATTGKELRGIGCVFDYIEDNPIGVTIFPASLSPPPLPGGVPSISAGDWVLLDLKAYIAGCSNATTAKGFTRTSHEIQATLSVTRPPRISHLCVHCPALKPADFGTEPVILAACDGFVFFRAAICNSYHSENPSLQDYFLYRAPLSRMHGQPSLTRLPQPDPSFARCGVGLLRCDGGDGDGDGDGDGGGLTLRPHCIPQQHYVVAGLCRSQGRSGDYTRYDLHRFDSREGKWTTKVLQLGPMAPSPGLTFFYHMTHKVVTLGGGIVGWVDLCRGILLCDVLADRPQLHYISLPDLPLSKTGELLSEASAQEFRDIAVVRGGYIWCVEHQTQADDWMVTTWSWKVSDLTSVSVWEGRWEKECMIAASRIAGSASLPPLQHLHTGLPSLSLDDHGVVYVVAKVDHQDDRALILAVNVGDGELQAAEYIGAERDITYTQYRTSEITPGKMVKHKKRGSLPTSSRTKKLGLSQVELKI